MSESKREYSPRNGQGTNALTSEKRLIVTTARRGGASGSKSRVVEVVHVRRNRSKPVEHGTPPTPWTPREETWLKSFEKKPAPPPLPADVDPALSKPAQPVVHVMPIWEPSPQPLEPPAVTPAEEPTRLTAAEQRKPRTPRAKTPQEAARHFADPFADGEDGANCLRCGYLVEPAREKRGLLTCASCG
ncbi:hypothetical protein [Paracraurococcus lichenis]|uniref:Uncharacterized protein n=1 Tax=Paracraurococcus lichenis TaxID=3064888 RepID=A0ABT9E8K2_9PROT|nr:hypothetical protein [Paracraurococcus sp. LOR1-02]MDO9712532.1 hypothetical protein [Paracraurococcus sp. LOR1-02]